MLSNAPTPLRSKNPDLSAVWFTIGLTGIFLVSLALRFWGISRFNTLVFDEVYYARFASHFLKGELIFTGHPPLSTYIVAIGIWIGERLPWGQDGVKNALSGLLLSPFSYRWLNALTGSFIPLMVGAIAYQLSNRRSYALIAALLIAADGLFLVESRYALNNVYLISFGLLGQLCFLLALRTQSWQRWIGLGLAGVGFGAAAAIKWNGLGFLLGAYALWAAGWILHWIQRILSKPFNAVPPIALSPLQNLTQLHLGHILICFAAIPALTYYVSWFPYMQLDPTNTFWELQLETLDYHRRVGGLDAHPYCSLWYTWPLMLRPIAYFYQTAHGIAEPAPVNGPPIPNGAGEIIYDVHAMGNPFLWWLSTAAILLIIVALAQQLWEQLIAPGKITDSSGTRSLPSLTPQTWITLYLTINWAANFLPWIKVTRCVFLYHYMEAFVFAVLALALLVDRWLHSSHRWHRATGLTVIFAVLIAFAFWMPLYLGLPITPIELRLRRWLPSWV